MKACTHQVAIEMPLQKLVFIVLVPLLAASLACRTLLEPVAETMEGVNSALPFTSVTSTVIPLIFTSTNTPAVVLTPTFTTQLTSQSPHLTETNVPLAVQPSYEPLSTESQLQAFEELWKVINENYLYPDFNGLDWNAVHQEFRGRVEAGMSTSEFYQAMKEMVHRLGDDHSNYLDPIVASEQDAQYAGVYNYVGIGVMVSTLPEKDSAVILLVFPGSPAEQSGLKSRDIITSVDGEPIVDPQGGIRRELLRGPEGSTIQLEVKSPEGTPRQVSVTRRPIESQLPIPHQILKTPLGKDIGYIFIPTFNDENVDNQVEQALWELTTNIPLEGLIIDNRLNGGGASPVFLDTLSYFTNGPVGSLVKRNEEQSLEVTGKNIGGSQDLPLVVLIDQGSMSFGEVFAGVLKDLGRATLIGEPTLGNVEILAVYNFFEGSRLYISNMTFRPFNHPEENWEETGITPDVIAPSDWHLVTLEDDPAIQAALEYLDE